MAINYFDHILSFVSGASASGLLKFGCGLNVEAFFTFLMFIFGNFVVASFFLILVDVVVYSWDLEGDLKGYLKGDFEVDLEGDFRGDFKQDLEGDLLSSSGQ